MENNWFNVWFESPYYHILYKNRDYSEAKYFIDRLHNHLGFHEGQKALDLACGRGRHSIYLHEKGLEVVGLDLSPSNIQFAKSFEKEGLEFYTHDMRLPFQLKEFDYIFNLFTSFGYFDQEADNLNVFRSISQSLKQQGIFVLDYLNPDYVLDQLVAKETKVEGGIAFDIRRKVEKGFIIKDIRFQDGGKDFHFQEKVQILQLEDFQQYFEKCGYVIKEIFGDYSLKSYTKHLSERMIFISQKKQANGC